MFATRHNMFEDVMQHFKHMSSLIDEDTIFV